MVIDDDAATLTCGAAGRSWDRFGAPLAGIHEYQPAGTGRKVRTTAMATAVLDRVVDPAVTGPFTSRSQTTCAMRSRGVSARGRAVAIGDPVMEHYGVARMTIRNALRLLRTRA